MNGVGAGKTIVNVNSPVAGIASSSDSSSTGPAISSAMPVSADFRVSRDLPNPLTTTVAQCKGQAGYIWTKKLAAAGGDSTDNAEIQSRITIVPVDCAEITVSTTVVYDDATEKSGYINVIANATGGTAMLLRGFEVLDGSGEPALGDYYDKSKGDLVWEIMLVGPFSYTGDCPFKVPFRIKTDKNNLWFATDGAAISKSFSITCSVNVSLPCGATTYPVSTEGGCGSSTIAYSILPGALPAGVPTTVTATATDSNGNKVTCDFLATRAGLSALICNDVEFSCFSSGASYSPTPVGACGNVTYTYSILPKDLPLGVPTTVTATGVDAAMNRATCSFTALRHGLTFNGFFSPLEAPGGTCNPPKPLEIIKRGSVIPVKFTTSCDNQPTFEGQPVCKFYQCGATTPILEGPFKIVANQWHFQIDTNPLTPDIYRIVAILQDGTSKEIVVRIK